MALDLEQDDMEIVTEAASNALEDFSVDVAVSQPLDENLFSNLTLMTPSEVQITLESSSPVSNSTVSRQTSMRKKKRAGLRIEYERDAPMISNDVSDSKKSMKKKTS
ncbi:Uncharacterized protein Adt_01838 [Abeliophyllum distichum]|uniref:Uncharacterized protein n=1 Tax=Abeliophyllum distichum TaxID=126358 RepID=A0ABD1VX68_9LAMI